VGSGVGLGGGAVDADGGLGGLRTGLAGGAADAAGADVDGGGVAGVEVGLDGRVLGLGEAGDALGDQVGLALGVGVPLLDWEALDSGFLMSSLVMWKVASDILVVVLVGVFFRES
jgi:hypothetical protein